MFNKTQSSQSFRRALNCNSEAPGYKYINGDQVFHRKSDGEEWEGPGIVIGQNYQCVLIRLPNTCIRVHPNNLLLLEDTKENKHHMPYKENRKG